MKFRTFKEEFDAKQSDIKYAEEVWGASFPKEYKDFLLKFNGGIIFPDFPKIKIDSEWQLWPINRIFSIGDLILQKEGKMNYPCLPPQGEYNQIKYDVDFEKLITFAEAERGLYYLNLDSNDFSQIYFACYSDWDGFVRVETNSFNEFINSLKSYSGQKSIKYPSGEGNKVYKKWLFESETAPNLGLKRFSEVYDYYKTNLEDGSAYRSVIQHYTNYPPNFLEFLIKKGEDIEGLLISAKKIEMIKPLIENHGLDFNKPYNGIFPIQVLTGIDEITYKSDFELIHKLLENNIEIDWNVKLDTSKMNNWDKKTPLERLANLHKYYYQSKEKKEKWWKEIDYKPKESEKYIQSVLIDKLINI